MAPAAAAAFTALRHTRHATQLSANIRRSFEDEVLQKVPDTAQILETGLVWKLCVGGHSNYQPRRAYLTKEFLGLTTVGAKTLRDVIPIVDITKVHAKVKEEDDTVVNAVPEKHRVGSILKKAHTLRGHAAQVESAPDSPIAHSNDDGAEWDSVHTFMIHTEETSSTGGRTYIIQVHSQQEAEKWISTLIDASVSARKERDMRQKSLLFRCREFLRKWYESSIFQVAFALLIGFNFVANVAEAQTVPEKDSPTERSYRDLDIAFTSLFAFELAWNMFCHEARAFWHDGWNVFDVVVVLFSVLSVMFQNMPLLSSLRLLRVFRAVRLFRKLTSLRIIFNAIIGSLFPVLNSVFIMVTITAMYAILAVELYGDRAEEFADFQHSMFSMYQVATGDSWASALARDLLWVQVGAELELDRSVMVFFVTYSIVSSMVLLNVVVAVLLDNFTRCVSEEEAANAQVRANKYNKISDINVSCLDPVLEHLSYFEGKEHLKEMSDALFDSLDTEGSEKLGFHELKTGLETLNVEPKIRFTPDEFEFMTVGGTLCDLDAKLSRQHLFVVFQRLLELYTKRRLAKVMAGEPEHEPSRKGLRLAAIKVLLSQNTRLAASHSEAASGAAAAQIAPARAAEEEDNDDEGSILATQLQMERGAAGVTGLQMPSRGLRGNGGMHGQTTADAGTQTASVYVCF